MGKICICGFSNSLVAFNPGNLFIIDTDSWYGRACWVVYPRLALNTSSKSSLHDLAFSQAFYATKRLPSIFSTQAMEGPTLGTYPLGAGGSNRRGCWGGAASAWWATIIIYMPIDGLCIHQRLTLPCPSHPCRPQYRTYITVRECRHPRGWSTRPEAASGTGRRPQQGREAAHVPICMAHSPESHALRSQVMYVVVVVVHFFVAAVGGSSKSYSAWIPCHKWSAFSSR